MKTKQMPKLYYNEKDSGMAFLMTVAGFLGMTLVIMVISQVYTAMVLSGRVQPSQGFTFLTLILPQTVFILVFCMINLTTKTDFVRAAGLKKGFSPILIPVILLGVTVLITLDVPILTAWEWLLAKIGFRSENFSALDIKEMTKTAGGLVMTVLVVCVLPAIGEELIFRGVVFRGIAASGRKGTALVLSALAFSLMHMSPLQTIHQFVLGLAAAYLVLRTDSLYPAILLHFANNFISVIYEYFGLSLIGIESLVFNMAAGLICLIIGIIIVCTAVDAVTGNLRHNLVTSRILRSRARRNSFYRSVKWLDGKGAVAEGERFWLELPTMREGIDDPAIVATVTAARSQEQVTSYKKNAKGMYIAAVVLCTVFWLINFALGFVEMVAAA